MREFAVSNAFDEVISDRERLREIIGMPSSRVTAKVIDHIDDICRRFIAASSFVVIATRGTDGLPDVSPKGDPAGSVAVLDEKTLAVPDRLGNKRVNSFENLLVNPEVALLFMVPGYGYTLRVAGTARIVRDAELQSRLAVSGQVPHVVLIVTVKQAFMHCAKSIARAGLWTPEAWLNAKDVPTLAEAMVAHGKLAETRSEMQAMIERDFSTRMY